MIRISPGAVEASVVVCSNDGTKLEMGTTLLYLAAPAEDRNQRNMIVAIMLASANDW